MDKSEQKFRGVENLTQLRFYRPTDKNLHFFSHTKKHLTYAEGPYQLPIFDVHGRFLDTQTRL